MSFVVKSSVLFLLSVCCFSAQAMSLQEFHAKSDHDQAMYLSDYVFKMRNDLASKNPEMAQAVWEYFIRKPAGKSISEGMEAFLVQELHVDALVKEGKADPAKVQIEGLIVYVVKQKFQPRATN